MKKYIYNISLLLVAALTLWSCSDDDDATDGATEAAISLSVETLQVDNHGGTATVTVTSSGPWRLAGVSEWAHPSATEGQSGDQVTFTIDPNAGSDVRTSLFKFFTDSAVAPLTVESAPSFSMTLASESEVGLSKEATEVSVILESNIKEPEVAISPEAQPWLAYKDKTEFLGKVILILSVAENATYLARSGAVTVSSPLAEAPVEVSVEQQPTSYLAEENGAIRVDYGLGAASGSFRVKTNLDCTAASSADWLSDVATSESAPGADGLRTITVSYRMSEAPETRGTALTISGTHTDMDAQTLSVTILQKDPSARVIDIPDSGLRGLVESQQWILPVGGSSCILLPAGEQATTLTGNWQYSVASFEGIGAFASLTSIQSLSLSAKCTVVDLSGLHKLTVFKPSSATYVGTVNLGDNPITTFKWPGTYSRQTTLTLVSSRVETVDMTLSSSWYANYDYAETIDLSGCTALKSVNAKRAPKVKTLILPKGCTAEVQKYDETEITYK